MLPRLLPGFIIIPLSYWLYTSISLSRFHCHVPSWAFQDWHFAYEIVPYIFVVVSFALLFRTARYALLHSKELATNIAIIVFAFEFSVFTFAAGYYQFGIMEKVDATSVLLSLPGKLDPELVPMIIGNLSVDLPKDGDLWTLTPQIARNAWDYVFYSLSVAIGDEKISAGDLCPGATPLRLLQDFANVGFGLLAVIVLVRFEPPSKT
ncbi:hypothetical protein [Rhizobium sp. CSW-27]|uniref:hypothetical protein n=1 Tax=Rhizobium sp. CSW-27 TaxID=2839985 RepID=UPI001C0377B0|nr:hypothetical protein [Rhizobium sp. CSW-27]MBT9373365.1 hypothetical protein [Rhizobium sp. CSW-27]